MKGYTLDQEAPMFNSDITYGAFLSGAPGYYGGIYGAKTIFGVTSVICNNKRKP